MADVSSHRACAHCRAQKVRCIPDVKDPETCQRCAKAGRICVYTPIQKRRQRKRTDTRVAELEREMRAMRAVIKDKTSGRSSQQIGPSQSEPVGNMWYDQIDEFGAEEASAHAGQAPSQMRASSQHSPVFAPALNSGDIVDRGLLNVEQARQFLDIYRTILVKQYPMVPIASDITTEQMRVDKPVLFLAIMAAASVMDSPEVSQALDAELARVYAERALVNCEKSLEIIQSLCMSACWYAPPEKFTQLMYYKYIHMAAIMALELGIATRPPVFRRGAPRTMMKNMHPAEDPKNPDMSMSARTSLDVDYQSAEAQRTVLATFCLTVSSSFSLRRPNMLRTSPYLRDCLEKFEATPTTFDTDRVLIAWVKLSFIISEMAEVFCYDDPQSLASVADRRTQLLLKEYERRLTQWEASVSPEDLKPSLKTTYYFCRIVLHEVALHVDHSPEDFKAPYLMAGLRPQATQELPIKVLVDCIADCISSAHAIMETYKQLDIQEARAMPVITAVRISYAAFVIAKLCLSSMSRESRIAGLIDKTNLKAEASIEKMILFARNVVGSKGRRVPAILMALLFKVRQWCRNPELIVQVEATSKDVTADVDEARTFDYAQTGLRATSDPLRFAEESPALQASNGTTAGATVNGDTSMYGGIMPLDLGEDFCSFWQDVNAYEGGFDWASVGNIMDTTNWNMG